MKLLRMVFAWLLPPWAFWRRLSALAAGLASATWLGALACTVFLWAGPGLMVWFVMTATAGALELVEPPVR